MTQFVDTIINIPADPNTLLFNVIYATRSNLYTVKQLKDMCRLEFRTNYERYERFFGERGVSGKRGKDIWKSIEFDDTWGGDICEAIFYYLSRALKRRIVLFNMKTHKIQEIGDADKKIYIYHNPERNET